MKITTTILALMLALTSIGQIQFRAHVIRLGDYGPTPEPDTIAQVYFSRNASSLSGWVNISSSPGPHSAIVTGADSRSGRTIGFSTIAIAPRWVKSASNYSAAANGFGESTSNGGFYFPAQTLSSCFYSQTTNTPGNYMLEISNLEQGGVKYRFEIMASADDAGVTDPTRECYYILTDKFGDDQSGSYNVKQNTANYVLYTDKEADSNGKIYLICNPTPGVANSVYGFISAMRIIKQVP